MTFLAVLPGSTCPLIEVAIDFDNDPTAGTTTWTDVTPYLVSYSRGPVRSNEFDQPGVTTGSLMLRNNDARFIPDNASGPYFGKLKKLRRVRVRGQWAGVTYNRFWGYVEDWPQTWDQAGKDQTVTLQIRDNFTPLETFDLVGRHYASELAGSAVAAVLADAGVTAQVVDPGKSTMIDSGTLSARSYALQRVQDIAASEMGVAFADGGGMIRFHDRSHRTTGAGTIVSATIGDALGEVPYVGPQPLYGDAWPIVNVTPAGGTTVQVTNSGGTAEFFQRTLNFPTAGQYLISDPGEALQAANLLVGRYANPITRLEAATLVGARAPTLWPTILSLDTSSLVKFRRRFLVNGVVGGTIELSLFIEGYGDDVQIGRDWRVPIAASPSFIQTSWLAGVAGRSEAGETTRVGPY